MLLEVVVAETFLFLLLVVDVGALLLLSVGLIVAGLLVFPAGPGTGV